MSKRPEQQVLCFFNFGPFKTRQGSCKDLNKTPCNIDLCKIIDDPWGSWSRNFEDSGKNLYLKILKDP